ncbi:efflux RND transporter periplasmic adaptor subunit [Ruegeria sediminis]|uniref:Efflux RND transporter periplasmic adaptor subunit n=1 Tax=Ruegeria sediminis TaxID=2583820 RepID=A0ABY2WTM2_9RHOB|nr:efflux RND transporter periplasmic adaptor subunit [Ruegeria sediminis]TMV04882.1 efflux RND transporter periplasmic adaptor subunit [Ruegeria sediminis]
MARLLAKPVAFALAAAVFAGAGPSVAEEEARGARGIVTAAKMWVIAPSIDGQIEEILFSEGQSVAEGDLLVTLDKRASELELRIARSELERANAVLMEKQRDLARLDELKKRDAVSLAAHGDAVFEAEIARLDVEAAEFRHAAAQENLKEHDIHATADGLVSAPMVHAGTNYSTSLSGPIATLVQLHPINVRVFIKTEDAVERLAHGEYTIDEARKLHFELLLPNERLYGHLGKPVALGFDLDPSTGEGSLLVEFPNPDGFLRPGLPVRVRIKR